MKYLTRSVLRIPVNFRQAPKWGPYMDTSIENLGQWYILSIVSFMPVIRAIEKVPTLPKPPRMKWTDLSIYDTPHSDYNDAKSTNAMHCDQIDEKIIHNKVFQFVKPYRKAMAIQLCEINQKIIHYTKLISNLYEENKTNFYKYMRDPDNLCLRHKVFVASVVAGFTFGSRQGLLTRKIFWAVIAALLSGYICFPEETDKTFRSACWHTAAVLLLLTNLWCGRNWSFDKKLPCEEKGATIDNYSPKGSHKCKEFIEKKREGDKI